MRYGGHVNCQTVKDVAFAGPYDEVVAAGSDNGRMFLWDRQTGGQCCIMLHLSGSAALLHECRKVPADRALELTQCMYLQASCQKPCMRAADKRTGSYICLHSTPPAACLHGLGRLLRATRVVPGRLASYAYMQALWSSPELLWQSSIVRSEYASILEFVVAALAGRLLAAVTGDASVVNCVAGHPHAPVLASCGIDESVKLWAPQFTGIQLHEAYVF